MAPRVLLLATIAAFSLVLAGTLGPAVEAPLPQAEACASAPPLDAAARATGADASWWLTVSADMARAEYEVSPSAGGLQAPNRAQGFRAHFERGGIAIEPRVAGAEPSWRWQFAAQRFGRAGALVDLGPALPEASGARVSYVRPGLVEWYENSDRGLEQGFTVDERPAGGGALRIEGALTGTPLRAEQADERTVRFSTGHGAYVLEYGKLAVVDAQGRRVPAELVAAGDLLAIVIDDAGATYPLVVDPLMTSPAWAAEGNQTGAQFGYSVATAGDVNGDGFSDVIVGAPYYDSGNDEGRAFVYHGSAAGLATMPAWTAAGDATYARFGTSVAAAGDVNSDGFSDIIVGAPRYGGGFPGRAFVYHGSAAGLAPVAAWSAGSSQAAQFGIAVAAAGDVNGDGFSDIIVGAPAYSNDEIEEGRALVYHGSGTGLASAPAWMAEGNQSYAGFGKDVATAGDVDGDGFADVIIGAPNYDAYYPEHDAGGAFVYHGSAAGLAGTPAWTISGNMLYEGVGWSVASAGDANGDGFSDTAVRRCLPFNGWAGRVEVYHGSAGGLATTPAWAASGNPDEGFGTAVATAGDVNGDGFSDLMIGAPDFNILNNPSYEGRAWVYLGSASGFLPTPVWTAQGNQAQARFGGSAATGGDVNGDGYSDVIVGAPGEGVAFAYHGSAAGLAATAAQAAESNQAGSAFGQSVAVAGDVNGDGYSDIIVGAPHYDNGESDEGRTLAYHGSAAGLASAPAWTAESNQVDAYFGRSVGTAGDVNGDGFADVIVGCELYDHGETNEGRAFVYHGSAAGLAAAPAWTAEGNQVESWFGCAVASAGDVNGDGYADVAVGARFHDHGETNEGRGLVYHGSAAGLDAAPAWTAESDQAGAQFAFSVASAGDVNGDGYSDVILGAIGFDHGETNEGGAFVYLGAASGLGSAPAWQAEGDQVEATFGNSVASAGDVNGDGFADVIIGADVYDNGEENEGQARVYPGSAAGLAAEPGWTGEGNRATSHFGHCVASAGDVNGDGYSDVIVGAQEYENGETDEGSAYVYQGSAAGLAGAAAWSAESNQAAASFAKSVGAAGDVNGDGYSDVIVGAPGFDNDELGEGRVFVYLGNEGDGLDRAVRMARADDSAPIHLLGRSDSPTSFRLKARGFVPAGRARVRLEWEVKPAGVPFDGSGLGRGSFLDSGTSGVALNELVSGLAAETLYHWRLRTASDSPCFPRSPWFSLPYNAPSEADVRMAETSAVADQGAAPAHILLAPVAPNPVGPHTTFHYTLPAAGRVDLAVYDVTGRLVSTLIAAPQVAGRHVVRWDGRDARGSTVPAGTYFARLGVPGHIETQKITVVR